MTARATPARYAARAAWRGLTPAAGRAAGRGSRLRVGAAVGAGRAAARGVGLRAAGVDGGRAARLALGTIGSGYGFRAMAVTACAVTHTGVCLLRRE